MMLRLLLLCFALFSFAHAADELLPPDKAFKVQMVQIDDHTLEARFQVAPGYYLYRDRISFKGTAPLHADLPAGSEKNDPSFGKVQAYAT